MQHRQAIQSDETMIALQHQAQEQVFFLKNSYDMDAQEIIRLYGGEPMGSETYLDAMERITLFNMHAAQKNGFVA